MKKTYNSINIIKGICIILVVFVHSLPNINSDKPNFNSNQIIEFIYNFCFLFFMPLFFFVSGFLSNKVLAFDKKQSIIYIKNKFKKLMIPYIIISILGVIVKLGLSSFALRKVNLYNIIASILFYPWDGAIKLLWFIYTLFIISIITILLRKISVKLLIIIFTLTTILPIQFGSFMNLDGILQYTIYYYLGIYFFDFYEKYKNFKFKHIISIGAFIILIIMNNIKVYEIYNSFFIFITSILGIICFVSFSMLIENVRLSKFLSFLGKHSFDIYLFSWFFQSFFRISLFQILKINYNITFVFMFIGGFLPLILTAFIKKSNILSRCLLGTDPAQ